MSKRQSQHEYRSTESKYKGSAEEMYITYDLPQSTRGGGSAKYPKVKRVYIAGDVTDWQVGTFSKQSGNEVHGVKIDYQQTREAYDREGYTAKRDDTGAEYEVPPTHVDKSVSSFRQIVELPEEAENVRFHTEDLPEQYRSALQNVS